jgi:hypothetical protein
MAHNAISILDLIFEVNIETLFVFVIFNVFAVSIFFVKIHFIIGCLIVLAVFAANFLARTHIYSNALIECNQEITLN